MKNTLKNQAKIEVLLSGEKLTFESNIVETKLIDPCDKCCMLVFFILLLILKSKIRIRIEINNYYDCY